MSDSPKSASGRSKKPMTLKPSARLQRYLGRELIADPNLALIEFVKNGYDAGASCVRIAFTLMEQPTAVSIADDGIGMDEESFRFNWLRPGFSQKAAEYRGDAPRVAAAKAAARRAATRPPAGEKGLGRLAAGRLGERLCVWTRSSTETDWLYVEFDWKKFDDMYLAMDEIDIPFEYRSEAPAEAFASGTLVQISALSQSWLGRMPGRPSPGRPRTRLGRLKQDLSFLIRARAGKEENFEIKLDSDTVTEKSDIGTITHESSQLDSAHYVYHFKIDVAAGPDDLTCQPVVHRTLERSAKTAATTGRPRKQDLPSDEVGPLEAEQWPGAFSGYFTYTPPPALRRAEKIDLAPTGVLVYRDDVLVEPYGLSGNDWLGVAARKASRQGHAAIQPSTFSGEVAIGRNANPELVDMSNRLGLLENDPSIGFNRLVRQEFEAFEELIYQEVLIEGNWKGSEQQHAADQAVHAERVAHMRVKALAHKAGQPLQAMGFDIVRLERLSKREEIPPEARARLEDITQGLTVGLKQVSRVVEQLSLPPSPDSAFDPRGLVEEAIAEVGPLGQRAGVQLSLTVKSSREAFAIRNLLGDVLVELLTNAIEAPRSEGSEAGMVSVTIESPSEEFVDVRVVDDGLGFGEQADSVDDFSQLTSTKGRPAEGLATSENMVIASRGALFVESTSAAGATVTLRIPTGKQPVPRPEHRK